MHTQTCFHCELYALVSLLANLTSFPILIINISVYCSRHQVFISPQEESLKAAVFVSTTDQNIHSADNDAATVCVLYLRVSQQLLCITDSFYGTFVASTPLLFLCYQHLVTASQQGARTAKCVLQIKAASHV